MTVDGATLATLVVAGATLLLGWATFRLGTRAAEETRAQWRPVLLVRARRHADDQKIHVSKDSIRVEVENVGRGPAFDVTVRKSDDLRFHPVASALAPGEVAAVSVPIDPWEADATGFSLAYVDLSNAGYDTLIVLGLPRGQLVQQSYESRPPVMVWWQGLVPRRVRPRFWPLTKRMLKRRGYFIP